MSDEIKIGRLARDMSAAQIDVRKADDGNRVTLSFPASSETPVERWFGIEVLSHDAKAVRMDRLKAGAAPLLFNHNWNDPVGTITAARLDDGRLFVDAEMFSTSRAQEVATMVEEGLRNVSIGYEIEEMTEDTKRGVFTATRWLPLEVSIVTVPADASVGIGRAADDQAKPVRVVRAAEEVLPAATAAAQPKESKVDEVKNAATGASVEPKPADVPVEQLEVNRKKAIENLCKANNLDVRYASRWINNGASLEKVADEILKVLEERGRDNPAQVADIGLTDKEVGQYSLFRMLSAIQSNDWSKAGFEKRCHEAVAANVMKSLGRGAQAENNVFVPAEVLKARMPMRRDLTAGTPSAGGYLVETSNVSFIELLRNRSTLMQMGATRMDGLIGNVAIPRQTGAATANWMSAESGTGAAYTDQTFGQLPLSPKTVVAATKISRQLQLQSDPSAESLVMADLAAQVALAVDRAGLQGDGLSGSPTGIINTGSIGGFTGTSITYALLLDSQTDLAVANTLTPGCGYISAPQATTILMTRSRFSNTDTPLWEGNMLDGRVIGYRAMTTNQMPSSRLLFGDFSQCIVASWGVLELAVNPVENFLAGIIGVRAMYSVDIGVRYAGAFSYSSNNVT